MTAINSAGRSLPIERGRSSRARAAPLSQTAEYALRAMSQLAAHGPSSALTAKQLAESTGVPLAYLSKIMRTLVSAGLLSSQKGHGGGFVLTRPAQAILLSDVLDAVDEMPSEARCAFGWGDCDAANPCPLHPVWARLNSCLRDWATSTTLLDIAEKAVPR
ncbi:MAG: Rrf2 family transcriptional regulator [Polyangiaceae bacterium]